MIDEAFAHMALFTFHSNIWAFHLQPIRPHEASTQLMVVLKVSSFQTESSSVD